MKTEAKNKSDPLVSIVTPTYNRAHLLPRCIDSVLNQTFTNFEHIIIDDASTDNTEEVAAEYKDYRIRYKKRSYEKTEASRDAAQARNIGIEMAQGEYIAFLDSDDEWLPDKLNLQVNLLKKLPEDYGVVYTGLKYISEENGQKAVEELKPSLRGDLSKRILLHNVAGLSNTLVKKTCLEKAGGFDGNIPSSQDWDLWIRVSKFCKFDFVDKPLVNVYLHGGKMSRTGEGLQRKQISVNAGAKLEARIKIYEKYKNQIQKDRDILEKHLKTIGVLSALDMKPKQARKYLSAAAKETPFKLTTYLHLLLSFVSPKLHSRYIFNYRLRSIGNRKLVAFK